jgi:excisionase family DNA binding protein
MAEITLISETHNRGQRHPGSGPLSGGAGPLAGRLTCTIREAQAVSGLNRRHIYTLLANGTIASTKVGKRRLIIVRPFLRLLGVEL